MLTYIGLQRHVFVVQYMFEWSPTFIQEISGCLSGGHQFFNSLLYKCGFSFLFLFFWIVRRFKWNQGTWAPKSVVPVVWWTWLGSSQLCWANYESSCVQNIDPTTHTYLYMQIYKYIYIYIYIAKANG